MKESSKSVMRRMHDSRFANRYFVGSGIDIGAGTDPISLYGEQFPRMTHLKIWDVGDGDAQFMASVPDETYDFVHSSHCLEHLVDPMVGLTHWFRILKPGGHMVVLVPDEDLYEQGIFPSTNNTDHKWTFSIYKTKSWSPKHRNLAELLPALGGQAEILKIEQLDAGHRFNLPRFDQTLTPIGEAAIEFVIRKRQPEEVERGGRLPRQANLSATDIHYLTGLNVRQG